MPLLPDREKPHPARCMNLLSQNRPPFFRSVLKTKLDLSVRRKAAEKGPSHLAGAFDLSAQCF
jgi:hypothetical protein